MQSASHTTITTMFPNGGKREVGTGAGNVIVASVKDSTTGTVTSYTGNSN